MCVRACCKVEKRRTKQRVGFEGAGQVAGKKRVSKSVGVILTGKKEQAHL